MTYTTSQFRFGPEFTPASIKKIILYTCLISLGAALLQNVFTSLFNIPGPIDWLCLSWRGMRNYLWWQPLSFLFTQNTDSGGIGLFFLITLFVNMYILWIFGSDVFYRVGKRPFLTFYFASGIAAGMIAFLLMPLTGQYGVLGGPTPSILALLIAWTLFNPENELLLFLLIPVKAKWLTLGIIGSIMLISLSNLDLVSFSLYLSATLIGYFWAMIVWGLHSPFPPLFKFELAVIRFSERIKRRLRSWIPQKKDKKEEKKGKVVDISTGKDVDTDDQFIDAMLEKISKYGESSLSWQERQRMQEISDRRRKNQVDQVD